MSTFPRYKDYAEAQSETMVAIRVMSPRTGETVYLTGALLHGDHPLKPELEGSPLLERARLFSSVGAALGFLRDTPPGPWCGNDTFTLVSVRVHPPRPARRTVRMVIA